MQVAVLGEGRVTTRPRPPRFRSTPRRSVETRVAAPGIAPARRYRRDSNPQGRRPGSPVGPGNSLSDTVWSGVLCRVNSGAGVPAGKGFRSLRHKDSFRRAPARSYAKWFAACRSGSGIERGATRPGTGYSRAYQQMLCHARTPDEPAVPQPPADASDSPLSPAGAFFGMKSLVGNSVDLSLSASSPKPYPKPRSN